jgi:hypothetical protein
LSTDFGNSWIGGDPSTIPNIALTTPADRISSMIFASSTRFYVGTTSGRVFRYDKNSTPPPQWNYTQIDNATGGSLGVAGIITDIAVDPTDSTGQSIYIAVGGVGDYRHVWYFNGTS